MRKLFFQVLIGFMVAFESVSFGASRTVYFLGMSTNHLKVAASSAGMAGTGDVHLQCNVSIVNVGTINQVINSVNITFLRGPRDTSITTNSLQRFFGAAPVGGTVVMRSLDSVGGGVGAGFAAGQILTPRGSGRNTLKVTARSTFTYNPDNADAGDSVLSRMLCQGSITVSDPAGVVTPGSVIASGSLEYQANHDLDHERAVGTLMNSYVAPTSPMVMLGNYNNAAPLPATTTGIPSTKLMGYVTQLGANNAASQGVVAWGLCGGTSKPLADPIFPNTYGVISAPAGAWCAGSPPGTCSYYDWGQQPNDLNPSHWFELPMVGAAPAPVLYNGAGRAYSSVYYSGPSFPAEVSAIAPLPPAWDSNNATAQFASFPQFIGSIPIMINGGKPF